MTGWLFLAVSCKVINSALFASLRLELLRLRRRESLASPLSTSEFLLADLFNDRCLSGVWCRELEAPFSSSLSVTIVTLFLIITFGGSDISIIFTAHCCASIIHRLENYPCCLFTSSFESSQTKAQLQHHVTFNFPHAFYRPFHSARSLHTINFLFAWHLNRLFRRWKLYSLRCLLFLIFYNYFLVNLFQAAAAAANKNLYDWKRECHRSGATIDMQWESIKNRFQHQRKSWNPWKMKIWAVRCWQRNVRTTTEQKFVVSRNLFGGFPFANVPQTLKSMSEC